MDYVSAALPPVRGGRFNPINFIQASSAEIYDAAFAAKFGNPAFLPAASAATVRMQFWSDALYKKLAGLYPAAGIDNLPLPIISIMVKETPNAFVSSTLACYRLPVRFEDGTQDAPDGAHVVLIGKNVRGASSSLYTIFPMIAAKASLTPRRAGPKTGNRFLCQ